jgi:hypothetical protein
MTKALTHLVDAVEYFVVDDGQFRGRIEHESILRRNHCFIASRPRGTFGQKRWGAAALAGTGSSGWSLEEAQAGRWRKLRLVAGGSSGNR